MRELKKFHPAVLGVYFVCFLGILMFLNNPVIIVTSIFCGSFLVLLFRKVELKSLVFLLSLFLLICISNPLVSHKGETPLFYFNSSPITLQSLVYGLFFALMLIAVIVWCKILNWVIGGDNLIYLFSKPLPKTALILKLSLRFIPLFKRQYNKTKNSVKVLGLYNGNKKIKSEIRVINSVIAFMVENSIETARAMNARGYNNKYRSRFRFKKFGVSDFLFLLLTLILSALTIIFKQKFYFYPNFSSIEFSIGYITFFALAFMPIIIILKGELKWKFLISKI